MTRPEGYIDPRTVRSIARYLAALPGTQVQIASKSGLASTTVIRLTAVLHGPQTHIGDWNPHPRGGPPMPVYFAGAGEDAPETLPRLSRKEICDRYVQRIEGTEEGERRRAKCRTRKWLRKAKAKPNTWPSILGVRAGSLNAEG